MLLLLLLFSSSLSNPATSKADLLIPRNAPAPRVSVPPKAKAPESTCRSASDIAGSEEKYTHTFPTQEQVTTKPFFLRSRPLDQGSAAGGVAPLYYMINLYKNIYCTYSMLREARKSYGSRTGVRECYGSATAAMAMQREWYGSGMGVVREWYGRGTGVVREW